MDNSIKPRINSPDDSFNGNLTAIPKSLDSEETPMEYGEMNEEEARETGYVGKDGRAVEMAKPNIEGSPTGALTDVGAGRSSVVHKHKH